MHSHKLPQDVSRQAESSQEVLSEHSRPQQSAEGDDTSLRQDKILELNASLVRLVEFVGGLQEQRVGQVASCVWEYYGSAQRVRIRSKQEVISLGQHRVAKMLRNKKVKKNWNREDIALLVWLVSQQIQAQQLAHFADLTHQDWTTISSMISGSTPQTCKFRWLSLRKFKLVTHKWSKLQSSLLAEVIEQTGDLRWKTIAQKLYEVNGSGGKVFRTAKQCRQHWNCFLNPTITKGPWSIDQDRRLLEYVLELQGSKKWSEIAKFMEGRTENALKNRFNLLVKRQRQESGTLTEKRIIKVCLNRLMFEEGNLAGLEEEREEDREEEREQNQILDSPVPQPPREQPRSTRQTLIVPQVRENTYVPMHQMSFPPSFNGFYGFMGGVNAPVMPAMDPSTGYFFTYLFPHQLL